ncbi:hypothetical protein [Granulicella mallensis]|uniref:Cyclopropane fatty-acyl-phospholipid synthase-like methyltransferase n=1 Tax=Granulicella mallensis TaxID=940614 RepID=A0A7W7ZTX3_9BACT|nr:hypothetical protein [Granulicella mallensis]MBB5066099.1 cyclopropane fatty-acyl-phospholipid synthase-like methyltransferase [Granulicella mallensis]
MSKVDHTLYLAASRQIARAVSLLTLAEAQLSSASKSAPNRHHRNKLDWAIVNLAKLSTSLDRILSTLESGCDR